jgi:hypothetical protein
MDNSKSLSDIPQQIPHVIPEHPEDPYRDGSGDYGAAIYRETVEQPEPSSDPERKTEP